MSGFLASQARAKREGASASPRLVLLDQGLSSVSNFLAVILVARVLSPADFGRFGIAFTVLTLALGLTRSYFGTRISLAPSRRAAREQTQSVLGALVLLALPTIAVVFTVSAFAAGGQSLDLILVVALAAPIVCLQDAVRFGAAAAGKPSSALVSDGLWTAAVALPLVLGAELGPVAAMGIWAGAAFAALVVALVLFGVRPHLRAGWAELRTWHPVSASVTVGTIVATTAFLWTLVVVSQAIGAEGAGSLRGAATTMGPVAVLISFVTLGLTPYLVRRARTGDRRFCLRVAAGAGAATLLYGLVLLSVPPSVGTAGFGESWPGIREILPWTVVEYTFASIAVAATLGLQVRHLSRALVMQKAVAATVVVIGATVAAHAFGEAWTVAVALMVAAVISAVIGWVMLRPRNDDGTGAAAPFRVGYTAGGFDLFHVGHVKLLRHAWEGCDRLVVGVSSDALLTERRGAPPVVPFDERMAIVDEVRYVDEVVEQVDADKLAAWRRIGFDVLFVGDNLRGTMQWDEIERELASVGVPVVYLPYTDTGSEELLAALRGRAVVD